MTSHHTEKYYLNDDSLGVTNLNQFLSHYYLLSGSQEGLTGSLQFILKFEDVNVNCDPESVLNDDHRYGQHTGLSSNSNAIHLGLFIFQENGLWHARKLQMSVHTAQFCLHV